MHLLFKRQRIFRISSRDGSRGVDAVAHLHFLHTIADRFNHTRAV